MPHEFTERPYEPEPEAEARMGGRPPGRRIGTGILEPRQPSPQPPERVFRFFAILIVAGTLIALTILLVRLFLLK